MPRKTRRPPKFRVPTGVVRPVLWPRFLATALLSAAVGAVVTYAVLLPTLRRAAAAGGLPAVSAAASLPAAAAINTPSPPAAAQSAAAPPPELTANLTPAKAAVALGNWYEDHKQWPQAIASYTQALGTDQDSPDVRTDLGVAYYEAGQPQLALVQYQTAQQQNPRHQNSFFNQGSVYAVTGDVPRAIKTWRTYIKRFPQGQHVADARQLISQITLHGSQVPFTPTQNANPVPFTPTQNANSPPAPAAP